MPNLETLDERLRAVERALTDDDSDLTDLRDAAELTREVERLAGRLDDAEERLADLDAATQALRGYVGNVRAVNESVERRADAALAKAESVETQLDEAQSVETQLDEVEPGEKEAERRETKGDLDERDSGKATSRRVRVCECECRCHRERRSRGSEQTPDTPPESDDDSGLLVRISRALS
jgi:chromosome segregation ATPase